MQTRLGALDLDLAKWSLKRFHSGSRLSA